MPTAARLRRAKAGRGAPQRHLGEAMTSKEPGCPKGANAGENSDLVQPPFHHEARAAFKLLTVTPRVLPDRCGIDMAQA